MSNDAHEPAGRRRLPLLPARGGPEDRARADDDGLAERLGERLQQQLAHQWALARAERRAAEQVPAVRGGPSNFSRAQVPWGIDLAAAWAWRAVAIAVAGLALLWLLRFFAIITLPLAVALLAAALASPAVRGLRRAGLPRGLAAGVVVLAGLGAVGSLLTFVGQQIAQGVTDLADQVVVGLGEVRTWLEDGPLNATDSQIDGYVAEVQNAITARSEDGDLLGQAFDIGSALGTVLAGLFIVLFATYFFLADGQRIWAWCVRLAPRAARERIDSSGQVAWVSLTQFVRATVLVALVDAIGIAVVALVLGVPFVLAIAVLVFLGAFVPMVGATVAGGVAVLVALVDQGPLTALLMLGGVVLVQQLESHVLQPFLMGRFVSLHPLGVILAIACGIVVAGVAGALVAVPLVAALNAVVQHLAGWTAVGDGDPDDQLAEDLVDRGAPPASQVGGEPPEPEDVEVGRG